MCSWADVLFVLEGKVFVLIFVFGCSWGRGRVPLTQADLELPMLVLNYGPLASASQCWDSIGLGHHTDCPYDFD